jgi:hypothetical protein
MHQMLAACIGKHAAYRNCSKTGGTSNARIKMQGQEAPRVTAQCPFPTPKADTKTERLKRSKSRFPSLYKVHIFKAHGCGLS